MTRRLSFFVIVALAVLLPTRAFAQGHDGPGTLYYGISAGLGDRHITGALPTNELPTGTQPKSTSIGALDLEGGFGLAKRVALLGIFDKSAALKGSNDWGSLAVDAVVRAWVLPHAWVEGGLSATELASAPPVCPASPASCSQATIWRAGIEAGGGYEIFRGPTISLHLLARYSQATFDGLKARTFTIQVGLLGRN